MREIKFRAWVKKQKKFLYFNFEEIVNPWPFINGQIPIMQYTGLKDKNGREIYESDYLKNIITNEISLVIFQEGSFNPKSCKDGKLLNWGFLQEMEVIGNEFENAKKFKG